jgi:two-component system, response regulator YesN
MPKSPIISLMTKLIAIVDDEAEMELIYSIVLDKFIKKNQIEMRFFSDSRLFELWLRFNHPDLILTDISMPFLTGPELGHRIRETGKSIKTYFVSGHEELDYQDSIRDLGISRYIPKPLCVENLLDNLKTDLLLEG